ncbi:MAG: TusE/DsrC/DsvC family sulfur relay protein [candidate division Zixibacteria bacterium]
MEYQNKLLNNKEYQLDKFGFLDPPQQWDENFAESLAKELGIHEGLTEKHWEFINYLRQKFLDENSIPVIVLACSENKITLSQLRSLFPTGYHRGACKIAGINFSFMSDLNIWLTYETPPLKDAEFKVNQVGFLLDFRKWNERFAHRVARRWNLPDGLTELHWKIIRYLRDYYINSKNTPTVYELCIFSEITLDQFGQLFPDGYHRGACRAAGLPFE